MSPRNVKRSPFGNCHLSKCIQAVLFSHHCTVHVGSKWAAKSQSSLSGTCGLETDDTHVPPSLIAVCKVSSSFVLQAPTSMLIPQCSAAPFLAGTCSQSLQGASGQAGWAAEESGGAAEGNHQPFHLILGASRLSCTVRCSRTDSCIIQTFFLLTIFPGPWGAAFLKPPGFPAWCLGDANLFIYFSPG